MADDDKNTIPYVREMAAGPCQGAEYDLLGYTVEELRALVAEGVASGPNVHATMAEVKAEARRRFGASQKAD